MKEILTPEQFAKWEPAREAHHREVIQRDKQREADGQNNSPKHPRRFHVERQRIITGPQMNGVRSQHSTIGFSEELAQYGLQEFALSGNT